nr:MAG TPA: hypothetical protein [Caudoviricetes sp.]
MEAKQNNIMNSEKKTGNMLKQAKGIRQISFDAVTGIMHCLEKQRWRLSIQHRNQFRFSNT